MVFERREIETRTVSVRLRRRGGRGIVVLRHESGRLPAGALKRLVAGAQTENGNDMEEDGQGRKRRGERTGTGVERKVSRQSR